MSSEPSRIPFHVEPEDSGWAEPLSRPFLSLHSVERRPQLNHPPIASLGRARTTSLSFRVRSSRAIPCVETSLASRDLGRQPSPVLSHATRSSLARAAFLDSISSLRSPTVVASQASTLRRTDLSIDSIALFSCSPSRPDALFGLPSRFPAGARRGNLLLKTENLLRKSSVRPRKRKIPPGRIDFCGVADLGFPRTLLAKSTR